MRRSNDGLRAMLFEHIVLAKSDGSYTKYVYGIEGVPGVYVRVPRVPHSERDALTLEAMFDGMLICLRRATHVESELEEAGWSRPPSKDEIAQFWQAPSKDVGEEAPEPEDMEEQQEMAPRIDPEEDEAYVSPDVPEVNGFTADDQPHAEPTFATPVPAVAAIKPDLRPVATKKAMTSRGVR